MTISLDHTIVRSTDKHAAAAFLGTILGIEPSPPWGPFVPLVIPNGVTLDYMDAYAVAAQHYAFLVDDPEFDAIFERIVRSGAAYYADPHRTRPGEVGHHRGSRGVYFDAPDGHLMEVLTRGAAS